MIIQPEERVRVAFICGLMMIHGYSRIITLLNFWTLFLACSREEKAGMRLVDTGEEQNIRGGD